MACSIKINGVEATGVDLAALLTMASTDITLRNSLLLDNYIRLTKDEQEIDDDSITYLKNTFGISDKDVKNAIQQEQARRQALGIDKEKSRIIVQAGRVKEDLNKAKNFIAKQFSSKGVWRMFGRWGRDMNESRILRDNKLQAKLVQASDNSKELEKFLEKNEQFLTPEDRIAITNVLQGKSFKTIPFSKLINNDAKKAELISGLEPLIKKQRDHIDEVSRYLMSIPGLLTPLQVQTLSDNMGKYTTIIYEAFSNPDWHKNYEYNKDGSMKGGPEFETIFNAAADKISKYRKWERKKIEKRRSRAQRAITALQSLPSSVENDSLLQQRVKEVEFYTAEIDRINTILADKELLHNDVIDLLKEMASNQNLTNMMTAGGKRGAISKKIFKKRKDIPEEVKRLFGKIDDPVDSYMATIAKISATALNAEFQHTMADINDKILTAYTQGLARGSRKTIPPMFSKVPLPQAGLTRLLTLPDSFSVLAGRIGAKNVYVSEEMLEFFQENPLNNPRISAVFNFFGQINTIAKINATVGSFATQERNIIANIGKLMTEIMVNRQRGEIINQFLTAAARRFQNEKQGFGDIKVEVKLNPLQSRIRTALLEQGIKNSDVIYQGINKRLKGEGPMSILLADLSEQVLGRTGKRVAKDFVGSLFRLYAAGDDLFKEALFVGELNKFADAYSGKTYEQLLATGTPDEIRAVENTAGEIIRQTNVNYSESYQLTKTLNESGLGLLTSPFAIFRLEQFRTAIGTSQRSYKEITNSHPDPVVRAKIRKIGLERAAAFSTLIALSTTFAANALLNDLDDEDEDFVTKWFVPTHVETPYINKDKDGNIVVVDMASVNIYGSAGLFDRYLEDMFSSDSDINNEKALFKMIWKVVEPIFSTQLGTGALAMAFTGKDQWGKELWAVDDEIGTKILKFMLYFGKEAFVPGTFKTVERIEKKTAESNYKDFEAIKKMREDGRTDLSLYMQKEAEKARLDVQKEKQAAIPGVREYVFNPELNIPERIYEIDKVLRDLSKRYKDLVDKESLYPNEGYVENQDRKDSYAKVKETYVEQLNKLRDYITEAKRAGYNAIKPIEMGVIKKGETDPELYNSIFSKKVIEYATGQTNEVPELIIKLYDSKMGIERNKDGSVKY